MLYPQTFKNFLQTSVVPYPQLKMFCFWLKHLETVIITDSLGLKKKKEKNSTLELLSKTV